MRGTGRGRGREREGEGEGVSGGERDRERERERGRGERKREREGEGGREGGRVGGWGGGRDGGREGGRERERSGPLPGRPPMILLNLPFRTFNGYIIVRFASVIIRSAINAAAAQGHNSSRAETRETALLCVCRRKG